MALNLAGAHEGPCGGGMNILGVTLYAWIIYLFTYFFCFVLFYTAYHNFTLIL